MSVERVCGALIFKGTHSCEGSFHAFKLLDDGFINSRIRVEVDDSLLPFFSIIPISRNSPWKFRSQPMTLSRFLDSPED
jgi:hypothetical protein